MARGYTAKRAYRPKEHVVNLSDTTRRGGNQYVRCLCKRNLLIGRVPLHKLGTEDLFAHCGSEKCGATVRVRRR